MGRLSVTMDSPELQPEQRSNHKCWLCMDDGFVEYEKVIGGRRYKAIAHCICEAGEKYKYNGSLCEQNKSPYYMPCISDFFPPEYLNEEAERNKSEFDNINLLRSEAAAAKVVIS